MKKYNGRYDGGWDRLRAERFEKQIATGLLPKETRLAPRPEHIPAWDSLSAEEKQWELYDMEADRTEINDLAEAQPERVAAMAEESFRLAINVVRLSGKALAPVGTETKSFNFRGGSEGEGDGDGEKKPKRKKNAE